MALDPNFIALFACPKCRAALVGLKNPEGFGCKSCALFFSVDDDVPNFNLDDARAWTPLDDAR